MSYRSRVGGALAVIWKKSDEFDVTVLSCNQKGAVSVLCRSRDGRFKCAVIACYVPPTSSPYAGWRAPLFEWIHDEYRRLSPLYSDVIIAGDLNSRWGTVAAEGDTRKTEDSRPPASDAAWRLFRGWCVKQGIRPTHGREGGEPGFSTSSAPAPRANGKIGRAESDYILAGAATTTHPRPPAPWSEFTAHGAAVHRRVACSVELKAQPIAGAGGGAALRRSATKRRAAAEPSNAPAPYHIPHYDSGMWKKVGVAINGALGAAERIVSDDASTFEEAVDAMHCVLASGAALLKRPEVSLRSCVYRRLAGAAIPPQAVRLLAAARALRKAARSQRKASKAAGGRSAASGAGVDPAADTMRKADRLHLRARRLARACIRARAVERDKSLRKIRPRDTHGFFTTLKAVCTGDNPLLQETASRVPDRDGVPATRTFTEHFRGLFAGKPAPPATLAGAAAPDGTPWTDFVPTASEPDAGATPLDAPFDWTWVFLTLFPPPSPTRNADFPFRKCRPGCQRCTAFVDSRADDAAPDVNPMDWKPRISTSKSAGADGLRAELIRWTQREDHTATWLYRRRMALAITATLNKALRDGMHADLAKAVLAAIYKGKGDRADPSLYRGIAMQNLVPKILSTLLSARLSHWAEWHKLIWPEQIGFKHSCGSEYHVMTLLETLKARAQDYRPTAVLFVDFYKAYDCVHPEAVWLALTKMGVPPALINLLRAWGKIRKVAVRINGELSEPFSVETGVAQGDPLSPLLFNLFMQSLSGWLASRADLHGARVNARAPAGSPAASTVVRRLLYADDLAIPAEAAAELQRALDYVKIWADAWGMKVNCGEGKTEAILFSNDGKSARPPALTCGGSPVNFVDSYVYLGRPMWYDMRGGVTDHVGPLIASFARSFTYNNGLRRAAASTQLQVLKTVVLGAANYLRGLELLPAKDTHRIDMYIKQAARALLGYGPTGTSDVLTWGLSGLLTAAGTNAREMQRVWLQVKHTPHTALDIVHVLGSTMLRKPKPVVSPGGSFNPNRLTSYVHAHAVNVHRLIAQGAHCPEPTSYADIPRASLVFGRSVAYLEVQRVARSVMPAGGDTASLPPQSNGSEKHAAWLFCYMPASAIELGHQRQTPLSIAGPGCSGSLHALADTGLFRAPANAALGNEALHLRPFTDYVRRSKQSKRDAEAAAAAAAEEHAHDDAGSDPEDDPESVPYAARFAHDPCRLCHAANASTIYHLITDCAHPLMVNARAELKATLPAVVRGIVSECCTATGGTAAVARTAATPAEAAALALITAPAGGAVPDSDDGRMLTYRILVGVPWPREPMARAGGSLSASAALGAVFDATTAQPSRLRRMASAWLTWSEDQLSNNIARRWRLAQGLPPLKMRMW